MGYPRLQKEPCATERSVDHPRKALVLSKQCEANPHAPAKTTHSVIVLTPLYKRHHMTL